MKTVLNIGLKNDSLINVEESSSEEYSKSKKIEGIIAEALGNIEERTALHKRWSLFLHLQQCITSFFLPILALDSTTDFA